MREHAQRITNNLSAKAMELVLFANKMTGSNIHPVITAGKRVIMDTVFVHPATVLVDTRERLETLRSLGLSDSRISGLVAGHFVLDYLGSLACMSLAYIAIQNVGMGTLENVGMGTLAARSGYGLGMGLLRETVYSFLPKPSQ